MADRSSEPSPLFALEKPWQGLLPEDIALIRASGLVHYQESATAAHTEIPGNCRAPGDLYYVCYNYLRSLENGVWQQ